MLLVAHLCHILEAEGVEQCKSLVTSVSFLHAGPLGVWCSPTSSVGHSSRPTSSVGHSNDEFGAQEAVCTPVLHWFVIFFEKVV